ncbi:MAG: zinc-binding dehydrogenase [Anaerolineae bacterium]|jgi:threonine dehydrogenase-like Zn-dependent dehydrogenase|nr:zinc-binding dehydrogenase [Chloroflexota bacterium]
MPRRLVCTGPRQLEWQEYSEPELGPDSVRVRPLYGAAKHGTEMSIYTGYGLARGVYNDRTQIFEPLTEDYTGYPFRVGNMAVGIVEELGSEVTRLQRGDRVCVYSSFAETVTTRASDCWPMPDGMPWQTAVCLDPADFALGAVRDSRARLGDAVAVFGMGAIGLVVLQMLRQAGVGPIIALEPLEGRRQIAMQLGAHYALDPTSCDAGKEIRRLTDGRGADVCIDYSGSRAALQQALRGVAYGGTVALGAYPPAYGAGLDLGAEAHHNVPNIVFTRACSEPNREHPRWDNDRIYATAWGMLARGEVSGELIVQPVVTPAELPEAYAEIAAHPERYLKLGVRYS